MLAAVAQEQLEEVELCVQLVEIDALRRAALAVSSSRVQIGVGALLRELRQQCRERAQKCVRQKRRAFGARSPQCLARPTRERLARPTHGAQLGAQLLAAVGARVSCELCAFREVAHELLDAAFQFVADWLFLHCFCLQSLRSRAKFGHN